MGQTRSPDRGTRDSTALYDNLGERRPRDRRDAEFAEGIVPETTSARSRRHAVLIDTKGKRLPSCRVSNDVTRSSVTPWRCPACRAPCPGVGPDRRSAARRLSRRRGQSRSSGRHRMKG
ncbi:hypothetical protein LT493_11515 [Streptomyces tricolor]|nr:hypothetical protein [Streptomyces tricolor]